MKHKELDTVVLLRDMPEHGVRAGDLGTVVGVHASGQLSVEFVNATGGTEALLLLETSEVRAVAASDVIAVRPAG